MKTTLSYYKKYIPLMLIIVVLLFTQAMCELALPGYMSDIINKGIILMNQSYIYKIGGLMLAVAFCSVVCSISANGVAAKVGAVTSRDLRSALFRRVTAFSRAELEEFSTASLITRSTNDVQNIQQTTVMALRFMIFAPCMGIGALVKAIRTSPDLTWTIVLGLVAVLIIMVGLFIAVMPKFKVMQTKLDRLNLVVKERLEGLLVIRAFNTEKHEEDRFGEANTDLTRIYIFVNRAMSILFPAMTLIMSMMGVLIVWKGGQLVDTHSIMIGEILAFLQYAMQVVMSFLFITMMFIMLPRAAVSAGRIGAVLDTKPTITDPEDKAEANGRILQIPERRGLVEFKDVSFAYPDASENALEHISFAAEPGQTTAIIGSTGSGKSTLITLVPRFYDVTGGEIDIDGTNIKDITQHELHEKIGLVPQKGLLFSGTIASNLQYGKSDATDEEMREACETAQAMEFINEMPDGFDTEVSQGGTSVSGGQKQRLSIARALIKKPEIYIFDDSFSALDFKTDAVLRKALKEKVGGSTFIIVAQRINTIMDADKIIVMNEGEIAGIGTHRELLNTCSVYKEIASSQLSEEELGREGA
ncbi:MAG: ABC transporter ATP-binding protein/permease [Eubacteriaceae bacterium]|nr:ABC transporter ATP-binding protein/permease [Eubacteriaceae bacterium]